jgi:succinate dehydrogenase / fumarate reductase iron-sulfur subunit
VSALKHPHKAPKDVKRIFEQVDEKTERYELNLYVVGYEDDDEVAEGSPNQ